MFIVVNFKMSVHRGEGEGVAEEAQKIVQRMSSKDYFLTE